MEGQSQPIPSSQAVYFNMEDPPKNQQQIISQIQGSLSTQARSAFIVKVYFLLCLQLALTFGMCALSQYNQSYRNFQLDYGWFLVFPILFIMVIVGLVMCVPKTHRFPIDMVLLLFFILSFGYTVSYSCSYVVEQVQGPVVVIAMGITFILTLAITLYAFCFRANFLVLVGVLVVVAITSFLVLMVALFSPTPVMISIYCGLGVMIYGIYLIFITKMIIGDELPGFPMDNYIIASIFLYIYIIKIFLLILRIVANSKK